MLTDQQLERYSRQVLLPEVGGRGQERLLASTVTLAGDDEAAAVTGSLLGRAGVGRLILVGAGPSLPELSPDCRLARHRTAADAPLGAVIVDLGGAAERALLGRRAAAGGLPIVCAARARTGITLVTLVGRPCFACVP